MFTKVDIPSKHDFILSIGSHLPNLHTKQMS